MALLKSRRDAPPGQWRYFQRETEKEMIGENESDIVTQVVAHRRYKNLHPQDPEEVRLDIHRQICSKMGTQECQREGPSDKWQPLNPERQRVTMGDVLAFSKATFAFLASGGELAPLPEVERRASICRACPLNTRMTGCACNVFYKAIEAAVPASRRMAGMEVCGVCHCSNQAKVNLTEAQVYSSNEGRDLKWPTETPCWQRDVMAKLTPVSAP